MRRLLLLAVFALSVLGATMAVAGTEPPARDDASAACRCFGWPEVDVDADGVLDRYDNCPGTKKGCVVDAWGCAVDSDGDGVCDGVDQCPNTTAGVKVDETGCSEEQKMARSAARATPPPAAPPAKPVEPTPPPPPPPAPPVSRTEQQLMTGNLVLEDVYFETNSAVLKPESEATLNELGQALEKMPGVKIEIQGHTDSRGAAAYNLKLSQARTESVRQYLLDRFRLEGENLVPKGYGESKLRVSPERGDADYAQNRRVEVQVLNPDALPRGVQVEKK
jgi:OOP family OmpA-OmpF porin